MKLWYRCAMCSPDQSRDFDIPAQNIDVYQAYRLVEEHHRCTSPNCPVAANTLKYGTTVEFLLRLVQ